MFSTTWLLWCRFYFTEVQAPGTAIKVTYFFTMKTILLCENNQAVKKVRPSKTWLKEVMNRQEKAAMMLMVINFRMTMHYY